MEAPQNVLTETHSSECHSHGTPVILNPARTHSGSISQEGKYKFRTYFQEQHMS